jgi:tRNA(fMet)-specific endonuclease VapC
MRGISGVRDQLEEAGFDQCALSIITLAELKFGAENSNRPDLRRIETETFCRPLPVLSLNDALDVYATEKTRLRRLGQPIADFDLLIGSTAIYYNLVLVTNNVKHFERMQYLTIENWTK